MKKWRYLWATLLIIGAITVILFRWRTSFVETISLLKSLNKFYLLILIGLQFVGYLSEAWLSQIILKMANFKMRLRDNLRVAILDVLGGQTVPLIGGPAITYYFYRKFNIPGPTLILLVTAWTAFVILSYAFFFLIGIISLPHLPASLISEKVIFIAVILIILLALITYWASRNNWQRFITFVSFILRLFNVRWSKLKQSLRDFEVVLRLFFRQKSKFFIAFLASSLYYLADIASLYFSFLAFGYEPSIPTVIIGFTFAIILPIFTLIPEIPGVMETSLVFVFISLGFPSQIALLSSLLFRFFSYWLPLPLGIISFIQLRGKKRYN